MSIKMLKLYRFIRIESFKTFRIDACQSSMIEVQSHSVEKLYWMQTYRHF